MPTTAEDQPPDPDPLEVAMDEAIAACGGNARDAVKALLEWEVSELMQAVSHATCVEGSNLHGIDAAAASGDIRVTSARFSRGGDPVTEI
jgi:hypothetical protein